MEYKDKENANKIICDAKTSSNKVMLAIGSVIFLIVFCIIIMSLSFGRMIKLPLIIIAIVLTLLFIAFPIFFVMKILNFSFSIDDKNIIYKNVFGKESHYYTSEIKKAKFYSSIAEGIPDLIVFKFTDNKHITITSLESKFYKLKIYLTSKNIL